MRAARLVAVELVEGCVLVVLVAAGLLSVGGLVEGAGRGVFAALPGWLFSLAPLLVGLGQGLALLRMELRGERLCLAASGLGPAVVAAPAVWMGLLLGLLALGGLRMSPGPAGAEAGGWVPVAGGLYQVDGGLFVEAEGGRIATVRIIAEGAAPIPASRDEARRRAAVVACCAAVGFGLAGGRQRGGMPVWLRGLLLGAAAVLGLGLLSRLGLAPELAAGALLLVGVVGWPLRRSGARG